MDKHAYKHSDGFAHMQHSQGFFPVWSVWFAERNQYKYMEAMEKEEEEEEAAGGGGGSSLLLALCIQDG